MEILTFNCNSLETTITDFNHPKYNLDSRYSFTDKLVYNLEITTANWGIFSMHVTIPHQKVTLKVELMLKDDPKDEYEVEYFYLELELHDIIVDDELNLSKLSDSIMPIKLELKVEELVNADFKTIKGKATGTLSFEK